MKKTLLSVFIVLLALGIYAQKNLVQNQKHVLNPNGTHETAIIGEKSTSLLNNAIGTTWYDLQSYNNLGQRIYEYPDGTIGAIWQSSGENETPDRGTGYNYYNGSSWGEPLPHLGDDPRTGWPTYAPWGATGEIIMHYWYPGDIQAPLKFYKREVKGEGDWTVTELFGPDGLSLVWGSIMTSGENNEFIHVLAYTYDDPYLGQENAVLYYRSSDGAETWEVEHELIDGMGIDYYPSGMNLTYSWAQPMGENIAFVYGPSEYDGKIFKSDDNGDSWDEILFYEAPFPETPIVETELFGCGDGNSTIALDSDGNAHVVFSKMVKAHDGLGGWTYYPSTEGVVYWNEGMDVLDSTSVSSYTNEFLEEEGQLIGYLLPDPNTGSYEILDVNSQFNYQASFTSFPQMGIDAEDNMFVTYTALAPGFDNGNQNYRHLHVTSSWDGGDEWNEPVDLHTDIIFSLSECVYPAMSGAIGEKIHILYQEDYEPGMFEWLTNHDPAENTMKHMEFDKDFFVGVENRNQVNQELAVSLCYPNPAVDATQLNIRMENSETGLIIISNMVGQTVNEIDLGELAQGNNPVQVQVSDLASGVYYLTVVTENHKNTQKLIVR